MRLLPDTHLLVWSAKQPQLLSNVAAELLCDADNELFFSAVSIWEVAIKQALGRSGFHVDPLELRTGLLSAGYREIVLNSDHGIAIETLPPIHQDPFDRILIAQAQVEGLTLLTSDKQIAKYPGRIIKV